MEQLKSIIGNVIGFAKNRSSLILVIGISILALLYLRECDRSSKLEKEKIEAIEIADNNMAAIKDSTVELKATREQLAEYDEELARIVAMNDSLLEVKGKVKTVTIFKFRDRSPDITVDNRLTYNDSTGMYELAFEAEDSLKSIDGTSRFGLDTTNYSLYAGTTTITDFQLNYGFNIVRYDDNENNFSRLEILPVYLNPDGTFSNRVVPARYLDIDMRGVDLLTVPYKYNRSEVDMNRSGWALGLSPISLGYFYLPATNTAQFGIGPSVSLTYYFTW